MLVYHMIHSDVCFYYQVLWNIDELKERLEIEVEVNGKVSYSDSWTEESHHFYV